MAEAFAVAASVIATIQIADRIIGICKYYLRSARNAPSTLRAILVEVTTLRSILETFEFLESCESGAAIDSLSKENGPIEVCERSLANLERLFPTGLAALNGQKTNNVQAALEALSWPKREGKAKVLLEEITRCKDTIHLAIATESARDVKEIKVVSHEMNHALRENRRQEVFRWLEHTDPSPMHNRAWKKHEPGTCSWILRSDEWKRWLIEPHSFIWIYGIPGAGKTVLISYIIEQLGQHHIPQRSRSVAVVYYYCYFDRRQNEGLPFLRWILNQLCRQVEVTPAELVKMHQHGGEPSAHQLLEAIADVLDTYELVYIIIDALDESHPREDLLNIVRQLATDSRYSKLRMIASSRLYNDIQDKIGGIAIPLPMGNNVVEEDIGRLVRSSLQSIPRFQRWPQDILDEVAVTVSSRAQGMFRWAVCQLDILQRLKPDREVITRTLGRLPGTLYETYDTIFSMIPEEEHVLVHHTFEWIRVYDKFTHGNGIPSFFLVQALEKSIARFAPHHADRSCALADLLELCGCLLQTSGATLWEMDARPCTLVSLAHYTVREYLEQGRRSNRSACHPIALRQTLKPELVEVLLFHAQSEYHEESARLNGVAEKGRPPSPPPMQDFQRYCILFAVVEISWNSKTLARRSSLFKLAFALLDPASPNFRAKKSMLTDHQLTSVRSDSAFWNLDVTGLGRQETDAIQLLYLIVLTRPEFEQSSSIPLLDRFFEGRDLQTLFHTRFEVNGWKMRRFFDNDALENILDISVFELLAQDRSRQHMFDKFLRQSVRYLPPSSLLAPVVAFHDHDECKLGHIYCPLKRLFDLHADPNAPAHVTPLQIAVLSMDLGTVGMLLKNGADPNDAGNSSVPPWERHTALFQFNYLHGASPRHICSHFRGDRSHASAEYSDQLRQEIIFELQSYGARDFHSVEFTRMNAAQRATRPKLLPK